MNRLEMNEACSTKAMVKRTGWLFFLAAAIPINSIAANQADCAQQSASQIAVSEHDRRLRTCALIGIWDSIVIGNNPRGYSGKVVAWVDDSITAVRAAIHDLDALHCSGMEPSELAQATVGLVSQLSGKDFDKTMHQLFDPASEGTMPGGQQPCVGSGKTAEQLVEFAPAAKPGSFQSSVCAFEDLKLPEDMVVLAAGAYSGRPAGFQIDRSNHEATRIDVAVNHAKPVALMLGAYEPTIWNVGWTPDTRITAVLVSGYHRQIVTGLKGDVPVINSSHDNQGPCGYFYVGGREGARMDLLSRRLFNHPVDMVYSSGDGKVLVGKSIPAGIRLVTARSPLPDSFREVDTPLSGQAGLDEAIKQGVLRRATQDDREAWIKAFAGKISQQEINFISVLEAAGLRPGSSNAYVVLKPFTYPAGLYGSNSVIFFILRGVPKPAGNPGHSTVYDSNTMECTGGLCGSPIRSIPAVRIGQ